MAQDFIDDEEDSAETEAVLTPEQIADLDRMADTYLGNERVLSTRIIRTKEEARELLEDLYRTSFVALDTEAYNLDINKSPVNNGLVLSAQLAYEVEDMQGLYDGLIQPVFFYNYGESDGLIYELKEWLEDPTILKIGHNAKFDWHMFANHGINARGFCIDTMHCDFHCDENRGSFDWKPMARHGLKECAEDFLDHLRPGFKETFGKVKLKKDGTPYASGALDVPPLTEVVQTEEGFNRLVKYAVYDAIDTLLLYMLKYRPEMQKIPWVKEKTLWDYYIEREAPLSVTICEAERRGMHIDRKFIQEISEVAKRDIAEYEKRLVQWVGAPINPNSGAQMAAFLFGPEGELIKTGKAKKAPIVRGLGLPVLKFTKGKEPSTKAEVLKDLSKKLPDDSPHRKGLSSLIAFKQTTKLEGTYMSGLLEAVDEAGRVHASIRQTGTSSGRFSVADPALQQIPTGEKDLYNIRDAFNAPEGCVLLVGDWAQLEYRLLAHFTQDPKLLRTFREGLDLHSLTTYNLFPKVKEAADKIFGGTFTKAVGDWIADEANGFKNERKRGKCFHPDTEFLTQWGWKNIHQLKADHRHKVAQFHPDTGEISFVKPTEAYTAEHPMKKLVHVVGTYSNMYVTPDHRMLGFKADPTDFYDHQPHEQAYEGMNGFYVAGKYTGGIEYDPNLCRAAVLFHLFGEYNCDDGACYAQVLKVPPAVKNRLLELLKGYEAALVQVQSVGKDRFNIRYDESMILALPLMKEDPKPSLWTQYNLECREAFLDELSRWCDHPMNGKPRKSFIYYAPDSFDFDSVQALCAVTNARMIGVKSCLRRACWKELHIQLDRPTADNSVNLSKFDYAEEVACISVPSSYVVTRFDGVVTITGQTLNFEIIYGVGAKKLAEQLRIPLDEAKQMVRSWFDTYDYVKPWQEKVIREGIKNGFYRTIAGRYRRPVISRITHEDYGPRGEEERTFVNAIIQGSASDFAKMAINRCERDPVLRSMYVKFIMNVHDENIYECPWQVAEPAMEIIKRIMERPFGRELRVPFPVSIGYGACWGSAKH